MLYPMAYQIVAIVALVPVVVVSIASINPFEVLGFLGARVRTTLVWALSVAGSLLWLASHALYLAETPAGLFWRGPLRSGVDLIALAAVLAVWLTAAFCASHAPSGEGCGNPVSSSSLAPLAASAVMLAIGRAQAPMNLRTLLAVCAGCVLCCYVATLYLPSAELAEDAGTDAALPASRPLRTVVFRVSAALAIAAVVALGWLGNQLYLETNRPVDAYGEVDYDEFDAVQIDLTAEYVVLDADLIEEDGQVAIASFDLAVDPMLMDVPGASCAIRDDLRQRYDLPDEASVLLSIFDDLCLAELDPAELDEGMPLREFDRYYRGFSI